MATELAKAYVQIVPSAKGIKGSITKELSGEASSAGDSAGSSFGSNMVGKLKGIIAAAGIGKMMSDALSSGADLQQSLGGIDTIYGEAADSAKKYAAEAAAAGISANDYAEQAVSFGAALKQAFSGDTLQAAEAANTAIMDMADNSAKFGTDIESIQNAYQGFAKQNYTMLDNLKLGYGGTKKEMERLLADAQKLSGVEYNIDNLGDVYSAIHVIQDELGVAGVAADEAKSTVSGSMNAMKAAAQNFMANLTLGEDLGPSLEVLGQTVSTFITDNLLPMVGNLLQGLPQVLSSAISMAIDGINFIADNADGIIQQGVELVSQLVTGVLTAVPALAEAGLNLIASLGEAIITTDWVAIGTDLLTSFKETLSTLASTFLGGDTSIIDSVMQSITEGLPDLLNSGVEIITNIVNGVMESIPQLIETAGALASDFATFVMENAPTILQAGVDLVLNLVEGIVSNLPEIASSAIEVVGQLLETLMENLPQLLESGITLVGELAAGIISAIPDIVATIPQIFQNLKNKFAEIEWKELAKSIIDGIINGIKNAGSSILDALKELINIGDLFGGGNSNANNINIERLNNASASLDINQSAMSGVTSTSSIEARLDAMLVLLDRYLPSCAEPVTIDGDSMMNTINRQLGLAVI